MYANISNVCQSLPKLRQACYICGMLSTPPFAWQQPCYTYQRINLNLSADMERLLTIFTSIKTVNNTSVSWKIANGSFLSSDETKLQVKLTVKVVIYL